MGRHQSGNGIVDGRYYRDRAHRQNVAAWGENEIGLGPGRGQSHPSQSPKPGAVQPTAAGKLKSRAGLDRVRVVGVVPGSKQTEFQTRIIASKTFELRDQVPGVDVGSVVPEAAG